MWVRVTSDASNSGWGGFILSSPEQQEENHDIATKEALALNKVPRSSSGSIRNSWVDAQVDNMVVINPRMAASS